MAEFHFFGSEKDTLAILDALLAPGDIALTPQLEYPTHRPKAYRTIEPALLDAIKINRGLLITGKFSTKPISFRKLNEGPCKGMYTADESRSEPLISISLPICGKFDRRLWHLGPGDLFRQRELWDYELNAPMKPSDEVKAAYADLVKRIKAVAKRRKVAGKDVWIGSHALELLIFGKAIILMSGKWLNVDGKFIKSNLG